MSYVDEYSPYVFYLAFILTVLGLTIFKVDTRFMINFLNTPYGFSLGIPVSTALSSIGLLIDARNRVLATLKISTVVLGFLLGAFVIMSLFAKIVKLIQMFIKLMSF
ncbi:MAG: hypothetical protein DRJ31_04690 [Candidatus Methanomethylicota archaeon]|uniref:Uncharacterized protein n=1 Tax=Thermoproteota archaeon TaxID=2056631 RepID=A0A497EQ62_9CREN|nr:MAG: hypothetical protein DRJ31_04690 [Candidatus Verstraetearchaeota archaeon]